MYICKARVINPRQCLHLNVFDQRGLAFGVTYVSPQAVHSQAEGHLTTLLVYNEALLRF